MRPLIRVLPTFVCAALVLALFAVASAGSHSGSGLALAGATAPAGTPVCAPTDNTALQCSCPPDMSTSTPPPGDPTATPTPVTLPQPALVQDGVAPPQPNSPTSLRVASFNLLGFHHTDQTSTWTGDAASYPDGCTRMAAEVGAITALDLDIVGFQEMQTWPQMNAFRTMATSYDVWPADPANFTGTWKFNQSDFDGSAIAWNKARWALVPGSNAGVTCSDGNIAPYQSAFVYCGPDQAPNSTVPKIGVLLQNLQTGQRVWVLDTHHPAVNTSYNWRKAQDASVDTETAIIGQLRAQYPTTPIILTGDMNSRDPYFCRATAEAGLISPAGGANPARSLTSCSMPANPQIDWIMSTPDVNWDGYGIDTWPQSQRETDHPVPFATAHIRPQAATGINHVILLDAEGLTGKALTTRDGKRAARTITSMIKNGAGTTNARTVDSGLPLPNLTSLLTGRPVARALGGHGVHVNQPGATLQRMGHVYSPSIFDRVHDYGGSTAFISSDGVSRVVTRSYDAHHGAVDSQGWSYGRNKISASKFVRNDANVTASVLKNTSRTLTVAQFTGLRVAGSRYGYLSPGYYSALRTFSQQVARILKAARATPGTLVILTADTGGHGYATKGPTADNYRVPVGVVGPGVARGNLYTLSALTYHDPATARGTLGAGSAIRNGDIANLVTTVLGLPALGTLDQTQGLNVF